MLRNDKIWYSAEIALGQRCLILFDVMNIKTVYIFITDNILTEWKRRLESLVVEMVVILTHIETLRSKVFTGIEVRSSDRVLVPS